MVFGGQGFLFATACLFNRRETTQRVSGPANLLRKQDSNYTGKDNEGDVFIRSDSTSELRVSGEKRRWRKMGGRGRKGVGGQGAVLRVHLPVSDHSGHCKTHAHTHTVVTTNGRAYLSGSRKGWSRRRIWLLLTN